jgi:hypothetical protein
MCSCNIFKIMRDIDKYTIEEIMSYVHTTIYKIYVSNLCDLIISYNILHIKVIIVIINIISIGILVYADRIHDIVYAAILCVFYILYIICLKQLFTNQNPNTIILCIWILVLLILICIGHIIYVFTYIVVYLELIQLISVFIQVCTIYIMIHLRRKIIQRDKTVILYWRIV